MTVKIKLVNYLQRRQGMIFNFLKRKTKIIFMTPELFQLLSDPGKLEYLETKCMLIAKRQQGYHLYELYQSGKLYIELQVEPGPSVYRRFFSFNDTCCLEPYLEKIDIREVYVFINKRVSPSRG